MMTLERDGVPLDPGNGFGDLVVSTDLRCGRWIRDVTRIEVERVDVTLKASDDKMNSVTRPPTTAFALTDHRTGKSRTLYRRRFLDDAPKIQ
jgi:hypothetical protein